MSGRGGSSRRNDHSVEKECSVASASPASGAATGIGVIVGIDRAVDGDEDENATSAGGGGGEEGAWAFVVCCWALGT